VLLAVCLPDLPPTAPSSASGHCNSTPFVCPIRHKVWRVHDHPGQVPAQTGRNSRDSQWRGV